MTGASELADFAFALRDLAAAYRKDTVDERMVSSYWGPRRTEMPLELLQ